MDINGIDYVYHNIFVFSNMFLYVCIYLYAHVYYPQWINPTNVWWTQQ